MMTREERLKILNNIQSHFDAIWGLSHELDSREDAYILELLLPEFNPRAWPGGRRSLAWELQRYILDLELELE